MTTKIKAGVIEAGAISTASLADTSITAAKLAGTLDLTGKTVTVATATAGDNDTTVASTAFVTTAIANLTDSAPAALDTLNELAAALNDDANFSTTVTNSIALKAPLASPDFTGDVTFDTSTLVVDSTNDRVGIGTSSPAVKLAVSNNGAEGIEIVPSGGGEPIIQSYNRSGAAFTSLRVTASDLKFYAGSSPTEAMRIDSSGNVGIGTTSPDVPLEVVSASPTNGIVADFVNSTNAGGTTAAIKLSNSDTESCDVVLGANRVGANFGSDFFISLSDSVDGSNQERFRITEAGNVGIGTTNASKKLTVSDSGGTSFATTGVVSDMSGGAYIQVSDPQNSVDNILAGIQFSAFNGDSIIAGTYDSTNNSSLLFGTETSGTVSEKMRINSSGNVGIGTASPDSLLHVAKTSGTDVDIARFSGASSAFNIKCSDLSASTPTWTLRTFSGETLAFGEGLNESARFDGSGNFLVGTTSAVVANASSNVGTAIGAGLVESARAGVVAQFNRHTSDGTIVDLQKDGTTVGSIGADGNSLYIDGGSSNYAVMLASDFRPRTSNGAANNDAAVDLGDSLARWKDLYLSGTASIGNLTIAGAQGTDGQLLTSTGSGIAWEDAPAGGPTFKTFGTGSIMIGDDTTGTINAADNNTGLGVDVFAALTEGDGNIAVGKSALLSNTTGDENTAVGLEALNQNVSGGGNTAVGRVALRANTASNNTAVGTVSLYSNTSGASNVAVGAYALQTNATSSNNTAVGRGALLANTAGDNTAVGYNALTSSTTATQVTALGFRAGEDSTASSSTFIGYLAGAETTTGSQNTFIGASTAESGVCTGTSNTAVGGNNFTGITSGSYNCVMGTHAMRNFQTGEGNVVLGYNAKRLHSSGDDAVVIGNHAGYNMTTGRSVVVGNEAFYDGTSTDDSVFIGNQAGYNVTTGYTNVIIGDRAGDTSRTTGYGSVIIGYKAGRNSNGNANVFVGNGAGNTTYGSYNTCLGVSANFNNNNNGGIIIGYGGSPGAAGTYATLAYGGNKSWISLGATGWSGSSDERLKENIRPSKAGLSFINDLKPVNFDWRKKKDIDPELETHKSDSDERYEKDNPMGKIGFIAQDVKEALDNHPEVISHLWEEQEDGTQALTPNELIPMLVKAVQELSAKVEELQNG